MTQANERAEVRKRAREFARLVKEVQELQRRRLWAERIRTSVEHPMVAQAAREDG